jgi:starch phosphorylase
VEDVRTGLHADALRQSVTDHLRYSIGRPPAVLTPEHYYRALALALRDRMQMAILNTARSGKFSSDRAIAEYCDDIWNVGPVTVRV